MTGHYRTLPVYESGFHSTFFHLSAQKYVSSDVTIAIITIAVTEMTLMFLIVFSFMVN